MAYSIYRVLVVYQSTVLQHPSQLGNYSACSAQLTARKNETTNASACRTSHHPTSNPLVSSLSYTTFSRGRPVTAHSFILATISSALAPLSFLSRVSAAGPAFATAHLRICPSVNTNLYSLSLVRTYARGRMPPKKVVKEEKIILGRPGNNLKSGIVCRD
jgi:hypothetical protein